MRDSSGPDPAAIGQPVLAPCRAAKLAGGDTVCGVSPAAGQQLLGRYPVESARELGNGVSFGEATDSAGARLSFVAVGLAESSHRDVARLLADQDRYRIGAPGVARPVEAGVEGERLVVLYERRFGESLSDWVARGPSSPSAVGHALTGIAAALGPLHDQGIAFGLVSSELVRIGPEGVSLEGFGCDALVRALAGDRAAVAMLPEPLRAPEQDSATPGPASPAADLFALGAIATELLIGRALSASDARPTPRACGLDVSDAVEALVGRAVARSPVARPADVARWAQELAEALLVPHVPIAAPPAPDHAGEPAPPPWRGSPAPPEAQPGPAPTPPKPAPPAPRPPPGFDSMPPSKRGGGNALWMVALVGGVLLMLAGVGGLFAYSLLRPAPVSVAPTVPTVVVTSPPPPLPAPLPVGPDAALEEDAGAASTEPDASAPLPVVGVRTAGAGDIDSPLPLPTEVPVWGSEKALVTVVVFGDLECPHTRRAHRGLESLLRAFPDDVRVAFRHRPLATHSRAKDAARVAAGVRRELGDAAFWRFVAQAAGTSNDANRLELEKWVEAAGGQKARVEAWLEQAETESEVLRDLVLAAQFDVRETPTLFVNGLRVTGFSSYDELKRVVDKELAAARSVLALGTQVSEIYPARVRKNLIGLGKDVAERSCPPIAGSPVRGAADALVTVVEFSDFECPFCRRAQPTLDTLLARHGGDLRVVWKHFPLDHHRRARPAAAFSLEVFEKGGPTKFWKAHDLLFASQADLGDASLESIAGQLGMPAASLLDAARLRARDPKIDADARLGSKLGVRGTPAFFVNGRVLSGAQPLERFEAVIKEELESGRRLVSGGTARSRVYEALCGTR